MSKTKSKEFDLSKFDPEQRKQIKLGLRDDLDVSIYAHHYYTGWQMNEIRLALLVKHPYVSAIANPKLDPIKCILFEKNLCIKVIQHHMQNPNIHQDK